MKETYAILMIEGPGRDVPYPSSPEIGVLPLSAREKDNLYDSNKCECFITEKILFSIYQEKISGKN